MIRTSTFIPERSLNELRALSRQVDVPVAELIRRAIDEYLRRERNENR
jgi:hypothetical protein